VQGWAPNPRWPRLLPVLRRQLQSCGESTRRQAVSGTWAPLRTLGSGVVRFARLAALVKRVHDRASEEPAKNVSNRSPRRNALKPSVSDSIEILDAIKPTFSSPDARLAGASCAGTAHIY
jgi:hypothetical protein